MRANSHHKPRLVAAVALRKGMATAAASITLRNNKKNLKISNRGCVGEGKKTPQQVVVNPLLGCDVNQKKKKGTSLGLLLLLGNG
ncbi:hypothetical protein Tco_1021601 [Tanacetum coccineum]